MKVIGLGGKLFILAYLVEGFSVDSFAIPFQWISASLISAGGLVALKLNRENQPSTEGEADLQTWVNYNFFEIYLQSLNLNRIISNIEFFLLKYLHKKNGGKYLNDKEKPPLPARRATFPSR